MEGYTSEEKPAAEALPAESGEASVENEYFLSPVMAALPEEEIRKCRDNGRTIYKMSEVTPEIAAGADRYLLIEDDRMEGSPTALFLVEKMDTQQ
jgi:hypothetical protein